MDRNFKHFGTPSPRINAPINGVPIVGLPFDVFECVPTVVMRCKCREDNKPITIPGIDVFKKCEHCEKIYGITVVRYDRRQDRFVTVTVSVINIKPQNAVDASQIEEQGNGNN